MKIRSAFLALMALALVSATKCYALQLLDVMPGGVQYAKISAKELTRLALQSGRIRDIKYAVGELTFSPDPATGDVTITPGAGIAKPINIWVYDDSNNVYGLILQPLDMPMDEIILRNKSGLQQLALNRSGTPFEREVKTLVQAMYRPALATDMQVETDDHEFPLWKEVRFVHKALYRTNDLVGDVYELTDISGQPLRLAEQEFARQHVVAVSIERMNLLAGETTRVMVIRERAANDD